jgi:hypothetical protein
MTTQDHDGHLLRDSVRVKAGPLKNTKGEIIALGEVAASVQTRYGTTCSVPYVQLQNYSRARRKGWETNPNAKVGRPSGQTPRRKMVSMRMFADLIVDIDRALALGLITTSRERFIEDVLRERQDRLADHLPPKES